MNHNPTGVGLEGKGEFITHDEVQARQMLRSDETWKALLKTRQTLLDIIHRVHNTYHAEGVAKPGVDKPAALTWDHCHRTVCRMTKALIDELDEGGYK